MCPASRIHEQRQWMLSPSIGEDCLCMLSANLSHKPMLDQNQARHIGSARLVYSSLVPKIFRNYSPASYGCTQEQGPPSEPSYRE